MKITRRPHTQERLNTVVDSAAGLMKWNSGSQCVELHLEGHEFYRYILEIDKAEFAMISSFVEQAAEQKLSFRAVFGVNPKEEGEPEAKEDRPVVEEPFDEPDAEDVEEPDVEDVEEIDGTEVFGGQESVTENDAPA